MAKRKPQNTVGLVTALETAGQADIEDLDKRIASLDGQIEEIKNKQASLKYAKKLLDLKLNGRPMVGGRASPKLNAERRDQIFKMLSEYGPAMPKQIAEETGIPVGSVHKVLKHECFSRGPDGYETSDAAKNS